MNEDRQPDWYTMLKQPVPGGGFSADKMQETHALASSSSTPDTSSRPPGRRRWYGAAAVLIVFLLWIGLAQSPWAGQWLGERGLPPATPTVPTAAPSQQPEPTATPPAEYGDILIGQTYKVQGVFGAKNEPAGFTANYYVFQTKIGESFTVEELSGSYAKIAAGDKKGWLPVWYLTSQPRLIQEVTPYPMLVPKAGSAVYLYPGSAESDPLLLDNWRVVRVVAEYGGGQWLKVECKLFEAGYAGDRWMKAGDLLPYDDKLAKEGKLLKDTVIYDESGNPTTETAAGIIIIREKVTLPGKGNFYTFFAPGGVGGLIKPEDFAPNPFATPVRIRTSTIEVPESAAGQPTVHFTLPEGWSAVRDELDPQPEDVIQARYFIEMNGNREIGDWTVVTEEPYIFHKIRDGFPETEGTYTVSNIVSSLGSGQLAVVHYVQTKEDAWRELPNTVVSVSIPVQGKPNMWYHLRLNLPYMAEGNKDDYFIEAAKQIMGVSSK